MTVFYSPKPWKYVGNTSSTESLLCCLFYFDRYKIRCHKTGAQNTLISGQTRGRWGFKGVCPSLCASQRNCSVDWGSDCDCNCCQFVAVAHRYSKTRWRQKQHEQRLQLNALTFNCNYQKALQATHGDAYLSDAFPTRDSFVADAVCRHNNNTISL